MRISLRFRSIPPERLEDFQSSLPALGDRLGGPLAGPIISLIAIGIQALLFSRWF